MKRMWNKKLKTCLIPLNNRKAENNVLVHSTLWDATTPYTDRYPNSPDQPLLLQSYLPSPLEKSTCHSI